MTTTKPKSNGMGATIRRLRLVGITLSLDIVDDDGDTLTPVQVQPIAVTAAQWPTFDLAIVLAEIERQLRQPAPPG